MSHLCVVGIWNLSIGGKLSDPSPLTHPLWPVSSLILFKNFYEGFAFAAMKVGSTAHSDLMVLPFLAINASCMGFGLLCTTGASLCLMFGSEKALLGGKEGTGEAFTAMDTAIVTLKKKSV